MKSEGKLKNALLEYITVAYYDVEQILESNEISPFSERIKNGFTPPETTLVSTLVDEIFELREHYQDEMPEKAIKRSNVIKKHLSAEQYSAYLHKLLTAKESDLSHYL